MIERYLSSYVGLEPLLLLQKEMRRILETLLRDTEYQGYLGVDMMIYQDSESNCFLIHPCVELNLRMSMGMVARGVLSCGFLFRRGRATTTSSRESFPYAVAVLHRQDRGGVLVVIARIGPYPFSGLWRGFSGDRTKAAPFLADRLADSIFSDGIGTRVLLKYIGWTRR